MRIVEELFAQGHPNIRGKHPTTFEVTKDRELTRRGDCVIGVNAGKGPRDLSSEFRDLCRHDESRIIVELQAAGITEVIVGKGSPKLALSHSSESVGRKSSYVSDRTIMVMADRAACDLDRGLIEVLTSPATRLRVQITVEL